ncbi:putative cytochrome p450 alkane [Phaeomoniella chlamydospora]|uniref:Putative cytochrome p450 alkane n=1 Tax=Phaeomoniella chlamydospora TaxID=158046 RepID=A0A0G2EF00_PHACM|nr:putative cytochrome p450 alkane [Phaeomoniella chlamydospora]
MKVLWTVEPANIDALLSSKSVDYFRSPRLLKAGTPFLGPGLGTTSDHVWARHRQTVKPILDRHHQKDIAFYDKHLDRFFNALGIDGEWTQLQDLNDLLGFFTMDTSTEYFFGANTNSFVSKKIRQDVSIWTMLWHLVTNRTTHRWSKPLDGEALLAEFGHAFDETMKYVQGRYLMGKMYWLVDSWKFRVSCWKVNAAIDYFVDRAARKIVTGVADQSSDTKRYGLLEEILKGNSGNLIDVRDQVMHILIAGRDTTQSALSWAFALLGNNPSVFLRLRNEVLEHFGPEDDPKEEITFSTLRSCKYLQYTIKEVLRLYSSVQQPRETRVDTVLPVGGGADGTNPLAIPAGTTIMAPQYVLHRRTDHWGSDSGEFRPERWETKKLKAREYLPFSAGAHSCLGRKFHLLVLRHFDFHI